MEKEEIQHPETVQRAQSAAKKMIEEQYENIKTVHMSTPYKNPMGGFFVDVLVNGYGKCTVSVTTDFSVTGVGIQGEFPSLKNKKNSNDK